MDPIKGMTPEAVDRALAWSNVTQPTLRDQFAMAALTGWMSQHDYNQYDSEAHSRIAKLSYSMADAMLKERDKVSK